MPKIYRRKDRGSVWYMSYIDSRGKRIRKSTGTSERESASEILAANVTYVARCRNGLVDESAAKQREAMKSPTVFTDFDFHHLLRQMPHNKPMHRNHGKPIHGG